MSDKVLEKILEQPIAEGGIHSVNFFNGRLLTGKDFGREQDARRAAARRAAQAAGHGVAFGLEVEALAATGAAGAESGPRLRVRPGLAVSRSGRTLALEYETEVLLGRRAPPRAAAVRSFADCKGLQGGGYAAAPGIYLLTIAPAEDRDGRAPTHALDPAAVTCNTDTLVEGVQFRLLPIGQHLEDEREAIDQRLPRPDAAARRSLMRNRIAQRCFGLDKIYRFIADPLQEGGEPYGLLSLIDGKSLSDCDVPLAVVNLETGIEFVDMWSVRRRITRPSSAGAWATLADDRRVAEGEAMFLQFQEQLAFLLGPTGNANAITARQHFDYLPAAGILRMPGETKDAAAAIARFFDGLTIRGPAFIEGARLETLIRSSYAYPPIDLAGGELIWIYQVRENRQAIDFKLGTPPRPCLVFASGHLPYQADARFDVSRWDYANTPIDR